MVMIFSFPHLAQDFVQDDRCRSFLLPLLERTPTLGLGRRIPFVSLPPVLSVSGAELLVDSLPFRSLVSLQSSPSRLLLSPDGPLLV
jgi:hypothetical protein